MGQSVLWTAGTCTEPPSWDGGADGLSCPEVGTGNRLPPAAQRPSLLARREQGGPAIGPLRFVPDTLSVHTYLCSGQNSDSQILPEGRVSGLGVPGNLHSEQLPRSPPLPSLRLSRAWRTHFRFEDPGPNWVRSGGAGTGGLVPPHGGMGWGTVGHGGTWGSAWCHTDCCSIRFPGTGPRRSTFSRGWQALDAQG